MMNEYEHFDETIALLRKMGAISKQTAMTIEELGIVKDGDLRIFRHFDFLCKQLIVCRVGKRYYLDEKALLNPAMTSLKRSLRTVGFIAVVVIGFIIIQFIVGNMR